MDEWLEREAALWSERLSAPTAAAREQAEAAYLAFLRTESAAGAEAQDAAQEFALIGVQAERIVGDAELGGRAERAAQELGDAEQAARNRTQAALAAWGIARRLDALSTRAARLAESLDVYIEGGR